MIKTVLVIGATGELGAPVARQLHSNGYQVRLLVRGSGSRPSSAGFDKVVGERQVDRYSTRQPLPKGRARRLAAQYSASSSRSSLSSHAVEAEPKLGRTVERGRIVERNREGS